MKAKNIKFRYILISSTITVLMLVITISSTSISFDYIVKRLIIPILRLLLFIFIGLGLGQTIENLGLTKYLALLARPVFKFSKLGDRCAAAFISAFFSGVVANSMLIDFFKEKKISKMQLFLTNYLNQLPAYFLHLPTTFFIVLPLTGFAGVIYFILTFSATLLRFMLFLIFGRFYFQKNRSLNNSFHTLENRETKDVDNKKENKTIKLRILSSLKKKLIPRMTSIFIWLIPIYTLVFLLNTLGTFDYLNNLVSSKISLTFLPVQSISIVVISFAAEFTSGFAAAGAMMDAGILTVKQTVLALLLGNIVAFPLRALRHQIPRYLGIFSPKMGLALLLSGQGFRLLSLIIAGLIYYMVG